MIQLPKLAGSRASAADLIATAPRDHSMLFSFSGVENLAQGFIDELCSQLISRGIDKVTFLSPPEDFMHLFMLSHMVRRAKFFVETR